VSGGPVAQTRRRQAKRNHPRDSSTPGWGLFLLGLGLGLFVALLVYIGGSGGATLGSGLRSLLELERPPVHDTRDVGKQEPAPLPSPARTKFDFYTILPEFETVLPEHEKITPRSSPAPTPEEGVNYVLQAASYANINDADRLRAELALSGLEAYIEKVSIGNKGDYYRVRLGPFDRLDELNRVDHQLSKLGVEAMRIKVRKAGG
jgi:hypothetical protein